MLSLMRAVLFADQVFADADQAMFNSRTAGRSSALQYK